MVPNEQKNLNDHVMLMLQELKNKKKSSNILTKRKEKLVQVLKVVGNDKEGGRESGK
jgi:hypothetical protein